MTRPRSAPSAAAKKAAKKAAASAAPAGSELEKVCAQIHKEYGRYAVIDGALVPLFNSIPTGAFSLDFALLGGIKEGLVTMYYGWENSGKTTMALKTAIQFQRKYPDKWVVFVDAERTLDRSWAERLGVNMARFKYCSPVTGQEGVDMIDVFMRTLEVGLIIVDSVPALVPSEIIRKSAEEFTRAESARLMGTLCSKITTNFATERKRDHIVTLIFTNQWREGQVSTPRADPKYLPGGKQLNRFVATNKVEFKNREIISGTKSGERGVKSDTSDVEDGGMKMVMVNEHAFKIGKDKGGLMKAGDFRMVMSKKYRPGLLVPGDFDDASIVVLFASRLGIYSRGGKGFKLNGFNVEFTKKDDVIPWLYKNAEAYLRLRQMLVALHRREVGVAEFPEDGYLLGEVPEEGLDLPDVSLENLVPEEQREGIAEDEEE
jgi:recombination protein RecA